MDNFFLVSGVSALLYSLYSLADYFSFWGITALRKKEAKNLILQGIIKNVIDVRTKSEWNASHYKSSIHIPLNSLTRDNTKLQSLNKNDEIFLCCKTGKRALEGAKLLHNYGFKKVYYLTNDRLS